METGFYQDKPPIDELIHYGMPRRSGRYPYGSGKDPYQHSGDFLSRVDTLKKSGMSDTEIAKSMGLTTTQFRTQKSLAKDERRSLEVDRAKSLRADGKSLNEIAEIMGYKNDSSIRSLLNENSEARMNQARATADFIKKHVDEKGLIDVGVGVERELGISKEKLDQALYILEMEGYQRHGGRMEQATNPGKFTTLKVIGPPESKNSDIYDPEKIHSLADYESHDGGDTFDPKFVYPKSMDSSRLKIRYAEDGGIEKDGLVEIRRNVDDLSLGGSRYAQVRILVDDTHYIKGMAVYSDHMPEGVDVVFNTNKKRGTPQEKVLKEIKKNDPNNPFGSLIKEGVNDPDNPNGTTRGGQSYYYDKNGKKQLSLINKRAEEGDWGAWADKLPSQFLGKQNMSLVKKQLTMTIDNKQLEFDEIKACTNPTVKRALLSSFADDCDAAAVHLKAAALPRRKYQVIIPIPSMKDNEVYAPNYNDGEKVALVRYPHGGTFEIPVLTVNNKHLGAKRLLGTNPTPADAVGINSKVAERLSGADFDGDTVMVIPTNSKTRITSTKPLKGLEGFDPKLEYGGKKEGTFKQMRNTQTEMGKVSNLITDMTLKGATEDELARAVRHSMVVIDAEKHKLDYKQSEKDNGIAALKKKYQGTYDENGRYHTGAATLLSRAKSETPVTKRKGSPIIDPETGKVSYKEDYQEYTVTTKTGKTKTMVRTQKSTKMAETDDAYTLVSDMNTQVEQAYAHYANKMKAMANDARKEMVGTGNLKYSKAAKEEYAAEVSALNSRLNEALKNAPKERRAQVMANATIKAMTQDNPDMTKSEIKKAKQRALSDARNKVGAKRNTITLSDREWEAIQKGAISDAQLSKIIRVADMDDLKRRATPRSNTALTNAKISRMKALSNRGYTNAQIANALGISASSVSKYLNGKE